MYDVYCRRMWRRQFSVKTHPFPPYQVRSVILQFLLLLCAKLCQNTRKRFFSCGHVQKLSPTYSTYVRIVVNLRHAGLVESQLHVPVSIFAVCTFIITVRVCSCVKWLRHNFATWNNIWSRLTKRIYWRGLRVANCFAFLNLPHSLSETSLITLHVWRQEESSSDTTIWFLFCVEAGTNIPTLNTD